MSAQLGIGVHVATGWFPPQVQTVRSLLLRKGVIESGPYDRGFCYQSDGGRSEGCSCCQNVEAHEKHAVRLGELLDVPKYEDDSGYNFAQFSTQKSAP
jgi:hypothetical protein